MYLTYRHAGYFPSVGAVCCAWGDMAFFSSFTEMTDINNNFGYIIICLFHRWCILCLHSIIIFKFTLQL